MQEVYYSYGVEKEIPVLQRLKNHKAKQAVSKKAGSKSKPFLSQFSPVMSLSEEITTIIDQTSMPKKMSFKNANSKTENLMKPPSKDSEQINDQFSTFSTWNHFDANQAKNKLELSKSFEDESKTIILRKETEIVTTIRRDLRPILAQQISQIKRNGLSIVDFVVDPNDKIEIEKEDEEILVHLIKQSPVEISLNEFTEKNITPPKPTPVKIIRTAEDPLSIEERLILRLENKSRFQKLTDAEQTQLEQLKAIFTAKLNYKQRKKDWETEKAKKAINN